MKNHLRCGLRLLLLTIAFGLASARAADLLPVGNKVASDAQGNAIYQTPGNGIVIGYKLIGSGKPLMLLTGLSNTMDHWPDAFIAEAAKTRQLIVMDNRGMGYSTDRGEKFTYPMFAADVVALMDALGIQKTDVVGYSQSSVTTQNLLLMYPERVGKAVLNATSIDGKAVAAVFEKLPPVADPTIAKQIEAAAAWVTPLDKIAQVSNDVLLIVGSQDKVVGTQSSITLAGLIPGAWLVQLKNASHQALFELPADYTRAVLGFLESASLPRQR